MNKQGAGKIEWCDYTWNPIGGCLHDCQWQMPDGAIAQCYAKTIAEKFKGGYPQGFEHHYWRPEKLNAPLALRTPSKIFLDSMSDLMGHWIPDEQIQAVLDVCRKAHWHTFQLLTKNAPRLAKFQFPPNVWVGASVPPTFYMGKRLSDEQQRRMLLRTLAILRGVNVPVRWMSIEPLSWDIAWQMEDHDLQWIVIGAASNGRKIYQPKSEWVGNLLTLMDETITPVWFKGNLRDNAAAIPWREEFPLPIAFQRQLL